MREEELEECRGQRNLRRPAGRAHRRAGPIATSAVAAAAPAPAGWPSQRRKRRESPRSRARTNPHTDRAEDVETTKTTFAAVGECGRARARRHRRRRSGPEGQSSRHSNLGRSHRRNHRCQHGSPRRNPSGSAPAGADVVDMGEAAGMGGSRPRDGRSDVEKRSRCSWRVSTL